MITIDQVEHLHVELSSLCQAACPLCARNDHGYKDRTDFPKTSLTLQDWKTVFDSSKINLKKINFNGNFGDPLMAIDIKDILVYCYKKWPDVMVEISTNGGIRSSQWWADLAMQFQGYHLQIQFCIDGLEDTQELYRINVPYSKVMANAKSFIQNGGYAIWQTILFHHNSHQIEQMEKLSKESGFREFILKTEGRDKGFVFVDDNNGYWILPAGTTEKPEDPKKFLQRTITPSSIKGSKFLEVKWLKNNKHLDCVTLTRKSIFLAANGNVYPCCFTGGFLETSTLHYNNWKQVVKNSQYNAIALGIDKAIEYFHLIQDSWNKNSVKDGMNSACLKCTSNWRSNTRKIHVP